MKTYIGVMLAAALMLPAAAGAQEKKPFVEARGSVKPVPLPPGGPAPRMSDGHDSVRNSAAVSSALKKSPVATR